MGEDLDSFAVEGQRLLALICVINAEGYRVNNLFQLAEEVWQANLTDGRKFWEFGRGSSAEEALRNAWREVKSSDGIPALEASGRHLTAERSPKKAKSALQTILSLDLDL